MAPLHAAIVNGRLRSGSQLQRFIRGRRSRFLADERYTSYSLGLMQRGAAAAPFPQRHLLGIEGLSPDDINQFLDLADGYVELNRQAEKKRSLLRGRTARHTCFCGLLRSRTIDCKRSRSA